MVTSPYEWIIFEWDVKPLANKQTNNKIPFFFGRSWLFWQFLATRVRELNNFTGLIDKLCWDVFTNYKLICHKPSSFLIRLKTRMYTRVIGRDDYWTCNIRIKWHIPWTPIEKLSLLKHLSQQIRFNIYKIPYENKSLFYIPYFKLFYNILTVVIFFQSNASRVRGILFNGGKE